MKLPDHISCFPLLYTPQAQALRLCELRGHDELAVEDLSSFSALALLQGPMAAATGLADVPHPAQLALADRDRLMAELYRLTYGNRIESNLVCKACGARFELSFALTELWDYVQQQSQPFTGLSEMSRGLFVWQGEYRFRLPNGEDELAAFGKSPEQAAKILRERCVLAFPPSPSWEALEQAIAQTAPMFSSNLLTQCPECGESHEVHFNMQQFLLTSLLQERHRLMHEIHRLAWAYKWSRAEILELPRSQRKYHAELIAQGG